MILSRPVVGMKKMCEAGQTVAAACMQAAQIRTASESLLESIRSPGMAQSSTAALEEEITKLTQEAHDVAALQRLLGGPVTLYPALQAVGALLLALRMRWCMRWHTKALSCCDRRMQRWQLDRQHEGPQLPGRGMCYTCILQVNTYECNDLC